MSARRSRLADLAHRFTDAFNRNDLDAVMAFFTDDAAYDEYNGETSVGREAIRAAFEPQFRGDFGTIRFDDEQIEADDASGVALVRWTCVLEKNDSWRSWRGLDVLEFDGERIKHKSTYAKAPTPLIERGER